MYALVLFSVVINLMTSTLSHQQNRDELLALLTEAGHYPLEVHDDSLLEIGIYRGDTAVAQSQRHAADGDIVVALIDNEKVALDPILPCQFDLYRRKRPDRVRAHRAMDRFNRRYGSMTLAPARLLGRSTMPDVIFPAWKPSGQRKTV